MNKKRDNDIKRMYKNRYTMQYIGDKYGISRQAVWKIIHKGVRRTYNNNIKIYE